MRGPAPPQPQSPRGDHRRVDETRRLKGKALRELCAKVAPADDGFPDVQDHTSQLVDAGIHTDDAAVWA